MDLIARSVSTASLIEAHATLDRAIDRPGGTPRLCLRISRPRPTVKFEGNQYTRSNVKDMITHRAKKGDVEALGYALQRGWMTASVAEAAKQAAGLPASNI